MLPYSLRVPRFIQHFSVAALSIFHAYNSFPLSRCRLRRYFITAIYTREKIRVCRSIFFISPAPPHGFISPFVLSLSLAPPSLSISRVSSFSLSNALPLSFPPFELEHRTRAFYFLFRAVILFSCRAFHEHPFCERLCAPAYSAIKCLSNGFSPE